MDDTLTCWWCWRRRLPVAALLLLLAAGLVWVTYLIVWYRPLVPCGAMFFRDGRVVATYCPASGPVWP